VLRFLSQSITLHVLNPSILPSLLHSIRRTFFPANTFPRNAGAVSAPDAAASKARCALNVLRAIPAPVRSLYLGADPDAQRRIIETWLDVLNDAYLNKHVVFGILELVLVRVVPEMGERGPTELLGERLRGMV